MSKSRPEFTEENIREISHWANNCAFACTADFLVANLLSNNLSSKTKEHLLKRINEYYKLEKPLTEKQLTDFFSSQAKSPQDWQAIVGKALRDLYDAEYKDEEKGGQRTEKNNQVSIEVIGWLAKKLEIDIDYFDELQNFKPYLDNRNPKTEPVLHVSYKQNETGGHFNRLMDDPNEASALNAFDLATQLPGSYEFIVGGQAVTPKPYVFSKDQRDKADGSFEQLVKNRFLQIDDKKNIPWYQFSVTANPFVLQEQHSMFQSHAAQKDKSSSSAARPPQSTTSEAASSVRSTVTTSESTTEPAQDLKHFTRAKIAREKKGTTTIGKFEPVSNGVASTRGSSSATSTATATVSSTASPATKTAIPSGPTSLSSASTPLSVATTPTSSDTSSTAQPKPGGSPLFRRQNEQRGKQPLQSQTSTTKAAASNTPTKASSSTTAASSPVASSASNTNNPITPTPVFRNTRGEVSSSTGSPPAAYVGGSKLTEYANVGQYPAPRPNDDENFYSLQNAELTISNLGANNAAKLIYFLVHENILRFKGEGEHQKRKYQEKKYNELKLTEKKTSEKWEDVLKKMEKMEVNPDVGNVTIRLIGDSFANDPAQNRFVLQVLSKLHKEGLRVETLLSPSNLNIFENSNEKDPVVNDYRETLKLLSYTLSQDGQNITVYGHGVVGLETIQSLAEKLGVQYQTDTAIDLARTIDQINDVFSKQDKKRISSLYQESAIERVKLGAFPIKMTEDEAKKAAEEKQVAIARLKATLGDREYNRIHGNSHTTSSTGQLVSPQTHPLEFLMANKYSSEVNCPSEHKGYGMQFVCGNTILSNGDKQPGMSFLYDSANSNDYSIFRAQSSKVSPGVVIGYLGEEEKAVDEEAADKQELLIELEDKDEPELDTAQSSKATSKKKGGVLNVSLDNAPAPAQAFSPQASQSVASSSAAAVAPQVGSPPTVSLQPQSRVVSQQEEKVPLSAGSNQRSSAPASPSVASSASSYSAPSAPAPRATTQTSSSLFRPAASPEPTVALPGLKIEKQFEEIKRFFESIPTERNTPYVNYTTQCSYHAAPSPKQPNLSVTVTEKPGASAANKPTESFTLDFYQEKVICRKKKFTLMAVLAILDAALIANVKVNLSKLCEVDKQHFIAQAIEVKRNYPDRFGQLIDQITRDFPPSPISSSAARRR